MENNPTINLSRYDYYEDGVIYIPPKERWELRVEPITDGCFTPQPEKIIWEHYKDGAWIDMNIQHYYAISIQKPTDEMLFRVTFLYKKPYLATTKVLRVLPNND